MVLHNFILTNRYTFFVINKKLSFTRTLQINYCLRATTWTKHVKLNLMEILKVVNVAWAIQYLFQDQNQKMCSKKGGGGGSKPKILAY